MLCAATHGVLAAAKMSQTPPPVAGGAPPLSGPTPSLPPSPVALPAPLSLPWDGIGPLSMSPAGPLLLLEELVGAALVPAELVGAVLVPAELVGALLPAVLVALGAGLLELAPVAPCVVEDAPPPLSSVLMPPVEGPSSEPECEEPHAISSAAREKEERRRRRVLRWDREAIVAASRIQGVMGQEQIAFARIHAFSIRVGESGSQTPWSSLSAG